MTINFENIKTPAYVIDENKIKANLLKLNNVKQQTGCKILLATKAYSCYNTYPLMSRYLDGTTNSSTNEARLSFEEFGKEVHLYSPAFKLSDINDINQTVNSIIFNSNNQFQMFKEELHETIEIGLRLNPEHIEVENPMYSPCAPGSRFGILRQDLEHIHLDRVSGFHIHALCQNNEDSLGRLITSTEEKFESYLKLEQIKWVNFGGGHMVSRPGYDMNILCDHINRFQEKYNVQVILEPGEAVVFDAGYLVAEVIDIVHNKMNIAILDASATAHMPDVLEMPYRPDIIDAAVFEEKKYSYRLGGNTCLSGDIIGEYSFDAPLKIGQKIVFTDMAQYTMVKNTLFNGIELPRIYIFSESKVLNCNKEFGFEIFKTRL